MRAYVLVLWCGLTLAAAAAVGPLARNVAFLGVLAGYEAVHIVAHLFLYGTLATLARLARLSAVRAALLALGIGVLQEAVQLLLAGRGPGWPELFDLCVDGVAILGALFVTHRIRSSGLAPPRASVSERIVRSPSGPRSLR